MSFPKASEGFPVVASSSQASPEAGAHTPGSMAETPAPAVYEWLPVRTEQAVGQVPATAALAEFVAAVTVGRSRLRSACEARRAAVMDIEARIRALQEWSDLVRTRISAVASLPKGQAVAAKATVRANAEGSTPGTVVVQLAGADYSVGGPGAAGALECVETAGQSLRTAVTKTLTRASHLGRAEDALASAELSLRGAAVTEQTLWDQLEQTRHSHTDHIRREAEGLAAQLDQLTAQLHASVGVCSAAGRPGWTPGDWDAWTEPSLVQPISLGQLAIPRDPTIEEWSTLGEATVPLTADLRALRGVHIRHDQLTRAAAHEAVRGLVARLMAAIPPGKARFTFFDPLGLGQAVSPFLALADHDPKLVDGKVWTNAEDLRSRLSEMTSHIENVIQKYLRGEYSTIEEFNADAGEIAEPYRILVVFDFPSQFDETAFHHLCRVIENGPRCGVYTILVTDDSVAAPYGVSSAALPQGYPCIRPGGPLALLGGDQWLGEGALVADSDPAAALGVGPGQAVVDRIVDTVGRIGRGADNVTVDFERAMGIYSDAALAGVRSDIPRTVDRIDPHNTATWWRHSSREALVAPIGQSGARDVAALRFDSETQSGALLVGRPGSGKSTLLHTFVAGLCMNYSPDEVELYLIDFKEGVEFKVYGELALPHARCVAVESEREFGLSVLQSIVEEMRRRAELIRSAGGQYTTFAAARDASTAPLPRIVLVFDEFHVLFAEDDKVGAAAADCLETIVRQGRGFGVHVLLGSQSLAGLDALPRHVLQLLPIRILLASAEADANLVLGDGNQAWKLLSRRGEGVLNPSAGAVEANVPFQAAFQTDDERQGRLAEIRRLADDRGVRRRPVVFEGYAAAHLDESEPADFVQHLRASSRSRSLLIGAPMSLTGPVELQLARESGANVLVVAKPSNDLPLGVVVSCLVSAAGWDPAAQIEAIDFTSIDDGFEDAVGPFLTRGISLHRRRRAPEAMERIAAEVTRRIEDDDTRAAPVILVLQGVHRARDLDPDSSGDLFADEDAGPSMVDSLKRILIDGPEVGVHTIAWVDSVNSLRRRLPMGLQREFAHRVVGQMSREDSGELLDSDVAATLKAHQVAVFNDDEGTVRRATSFAPPSPQWLEEVLTLLDQRSI